MINTTFITPLTGMPEMKTIGTGTGNLRTNIEGTEKEKTFGDTLRENIQNVKDLENKSLDSAYAVSMGQTEDIEGAMIDATKASIAIETAVQITTRAVNAYKEIVQMQI